MTGQYLPDINVWVALSMPAHTYHATVVQWMERHPSPSLHFCRYTQQGLLRLSTTSAVTTLFGQSPLTNRGALRRLDAWLEDPRIHFAQEPDHLFLTSSFESPGINLEKFQQVILFRVIGKEAYPGSP